MLYGPYMTEGAEEALSERAQLLLKALIENYIRDGQPVGSRTLSRDSGLSLSSATIRNVMADLEDLGFVASPHTSAGRIPTDKGYRFFVDTPAQAQALAPRGDRGDRAAPGTSRRTAARWCRPSRRCCRASRTWRGSVTLPNPNYVALSQIEFIAPVGEPRARHHGDEQPRGSEPRGAARSRTTPRRSCGARPII